MKAILDGILAFTDWVWGAPMLIWLVGGGIFLTIRTDFIQFRKLPYILKHTLGKSFHEKGEDGKITGFKAVTGALASTLGTGNIVGVAIAIAYGGPGAIFWMWVIGIIACAIKYCEVLTAMCYRTKDEKGNWCGGPMYYLKQATGIKWIGTLYAIMAALVLLIASAGHVGAVVDAAVSYNLPRMPVTYVIVAILAVIVLGGMGRLLAVTEKVVPIMSVIYILSGLVVIILNIGNLPAALALVFKSAFTGHAALGGFGGATFAMTVRWGLSRGVYSSDVGDGLTTISHCQAEVNHPVQQAMWGSFEVFFATLVICSVTALSILTTGVWQNVSPEEGSILAKLAFESTLGSVGGVIVTITLLLFAFTTAAAQCVFGPAMIESFAGKKGGLVTKIVYVVNMISGGALGFAALVGYIDFMSALMLFINLTVIFKFSGTIHQKTKEYFANPEKYENPQITTK